MTVHHGQTHNAWKDEQRKLNRPTMGVEDNPINKDAIEVAKLIKLDMLVNYVVRTGGAKPGNVRRAIEPTYAAALKEAKPHYLAPNICDSDIVIANAYIKASEFNIGFGNAIGALKPEGGSVVVIANSPSGQCIHYLFDSFGKTIGGSVQHRLRINPKVKNFVVFSSMPRPYARQLRQSGNHHSHGRLAESNRSVLKDPRPVAEIAVYPNADTIYFG